MSGYVRLYRSLVTEHPAFRNDAEAMAFAWLVAKAAWQPTRVRYKERILKLHRGQLAVSQRDMARALDRDKAWVERLWKRLKGEAMVEIACEAGVAIITICNYEEYQTKGVGREALLEAGAGQGQGTEQVREEVKKISSEAKASSPRLKFILPADIPAEPWAGYEEMRVKIGYKLTDRARQLAINELRKLADDGWPPGDVLNHCTLNSYRGIYPPKDRNNGRHQQSNSRQSNPTLDILRAANDAIARSEAGEGHCGARAALPPPISG